MNELLSNIFINEGKFSELHGISFTSSKECDHIKVLISSLSSNSHSITDTECWADPDPFKSIMEARLAFSFMANASWSQSTPVTVFFIFPFLFEVVLWGLGKIYVGSATILSVICNHSLPPPPLCIISATNKILLQNWKTTLNIDQKTCNMVDQVTKEKGKFAKKQQQSNFMGICGEFVEAFGDWWLLIDEPPPSPASPPPSVSLRNSSCSPGFQTEGLFNTRETFVGSFIPRGVPRIMKRQEEYRAKYLSHWYKAMHYKSVYTKLLFFSQLPLYIQALLAVIWAYKTPWATRLLGKFEWYLSGALYPKIACPQPPLLF